MKSAGGRWLGLWRNILRLLFTSEDGILGANFLEEPINALAATITRAAHFECFVLLSACRHVNTVSGGLPDFA